MCPAAPAVHACRDVTQHDGRERHLDAPLVSPDEAAVVGGFALRGAMHDDEQVEDGVGWTVRVVAGHLGGRVRGKMQGLCEADHIKLELRVKVSRSMGSAAMGGVVGGRDKVNSTTRRHI